MMDKDKAIGFNNINVRLEEVLNEANVKANSESDSAIVAPQEVDSFMKSMMTNCKISICET
jgi:hypothetical protein